jgi:hypothetical protein
MCQSVIYKGGVCNSPRQLVALLGGEQNLVWFDHDTSISSADRKSGRDMDGCLCPVDLAATLKRAGLDYSLGKDPMEWFVTIGS